MMQSSEDLWSRRPVFEAHRGSTSAHAKERGFPLVVVGGSAVEFYTEGGYMSGDIDFCRKTLKSVPPRQMMAMALNDAQFNWAEAERIANLPDFKVMSELVRLREEFSGARA